MSGVPYHAWTHRPKALGGTDPIATFQAPWIMLVNSGQTLPGDGSQNESLYTEAYWDSAITSDPTVGGGVFEIQSVDDGGGNDYWQLHLQQEGWYDFEVVHHMTSPSASGGANIFFQQEVILGSTVFTTDTPFGYTAPWTTSGPELVIAPYIESFRRIFVNGGIVETFLRQNSTVSKAVEGHLKVFYMAGFGGGVDNTAWEVAVI